MSWRHHCHSFNTFNILYHEKLESLQCNHLHINEFLIDSTTLLYCRVCRAVKVNRIPFHVCKKRSPLVPIACNLFGLLQLNVSDIQIVDDEIKKLTQLVLHEVPHSILHPMNHTINSINKDVDAHHLTSFDKKQHKLLFVHL